MEFYAHTLEEAPPEKWQRLEDHLKNVANLAAEFARPFGGESWAYLAGMLHDLGKYNPVFQRYLLERTNSDIHSCEVAGKIDHSTAGAKHAVHSYGILGHLLAYAIASHHSGLLDGRSERACLESRLKKHLPSLPEKITDTRHLSGLALPIFLERDPFSISFFVRMIFSCLVDADFLDTERFMDLERSLQRPNWPEDVLQRMEQALSDYVAALRQEDTMVNRQRERVRQWCLEAASLDPGLFSLTVPTGGGKTLSSLSFALKHANTRHLRKIIYVIPFTSIIEQNADVFRKVMEPVDRELGLSPVLEHHSNFDPGKETTVNRLLSENWDAPLVVTTSVQFYESLFSNKTSRCRKLHNLVKSVIILDEVQTLPVTYLKPCLRVLKELAFHYGTSIVLCTATQPAIKRRDDFPIGLENVREIIPEPKALYQKMNRVNVVNIGKKSDEQIAILLKEHRQVLCIVNTRGHARVLYEKIGKDPSNFHLSALMCPAHRTHVLEEIRQRLVNGEPCRVISTRLIEAGVDIDFPVVFRSLAGLDAIAQAAGRCNRNGRLSEKGETFVFHSEHSFMERFLADTMNCAYQLMDKYQELLSLDAVEHYFKLYFWDQKHAWDEKNIMEDFLLNHDKTLPFLFNFQKAGEKFKLIETTGRPVIIPWGIDGEALIETLRFMKGNASRGVIRKLQRFTIQVPERVWWEQIGKTIELIEDRFPVLNSPELYYSEELGLNFEDITNQVLLT